MARMRKEIKTRKIGKIWYYNILDEGFKSSGKKTKTECEKIAHKALQQKKDEQNNPKGSHELFKNYANQFFCADTCPRTQRKADEGHPPTNRYLQVQRLNLQTHIIPSNLKEMRMGEIKRSDILTFRTQLKNKRIASATVNKIMSALKVIFNEAYFRQDIIYNPVLGVGNIKDDAKPTEIFSNDELRRLFPKEFLSVWKDRMSYTCFFLTLNTGMRRGEVLALQWNHIHFSEGYISVEQAWKDVKTLGTPKNGKSRTIEMSPSLKACLLEFKETIQDFSLEKLVFCYADGKRLGETWWIKKFNSALENAEISREGKRLVPHSFRHQLGTILTNSGESDKKIQASIGWSSNEMQKRYTHWRPEHLKQQGSIIERELNKLFANE